MKNSIYAIRNREYYLLSSCGNYLKKHRYRETHLTYSLQADGKKYTVNDIKKITSNVTFSNEFISHLETPLEQWFWQRATENLKTGVKFSYFLRYHKNNRKVPNIETENWTIIPAFSQIRQSFLDQFRLRNLHHPRTIINSIIRTTGKHRINLRLGHIHLSQDDLRGRIVYGIHWDTSAVEFNLNLPAHWLMDDIPS